MSSIDPTDAARRTTQLWLLTAIGGGAMAGGLVVFFFVEPHTVWTLTLAAALLAIGVVVGVVAIYRATRLIGEGGALRLIGMVSVLLLVSDPLLVTIVGLLV